MGGWRYIAGSGNSFNRSYNIGFRLYGFQLLFSGSFIKTLVCFLALPSLVCAFQRRPSYKGVGVYSCEIYNSINILVLVLQSSKILLISPFKSIKFKSKEVKIQASGIGVKDSYKSLIIISGDGSLLESSFDDIYLLLSQCVYSSSSKLKKGSYSENIYIKL